MAEVGDCLGAASQRPRGQAGSRHYPRGPGRLYDCRSVDRPVLILEATEDNSGMDTASAEALQTAPGIQC